MLTLKNYIKKDNIVIDVGANIGLYTLLFSRLVGERGQVFAFEPEPKNFNILKKNIEENNIKNVILEQKAVGDTKTTLKMKLSSYIGEHRICNSNEETDVTVDSIKLDDYFIDFNKKIDFIKLDAEGFEGKILLGMLNTIQKNRSLKIMTEFYIKLMNYYGNPHKFLDLLEENEFKLYDMRADKEKIMLTSSEKIFKKYNKTSAITDLFCSRDEL